MLKRNKFFLRVKKKINDFAIFIRYKNLETRALFLRTVFIFLANPIIRFIFDSDKNIALNLLNCLLKLEKLIIIRNETVFQDLKSGQ